MQFLDQPADPTDKVFPYWPLMEPPGVAGFRDGHSGNLINGQANGSFEALHIARLSAFLSPARYPDGATVIIDTETAKTCQFSFRGPRAQNELGLKQILAMIQRIKALRPGLKLGLNVFPFTNFGETWKDDPARVAELWDEQAYINDVMIRDIIPELDTLAFELYYADRWGDWQKNFWENVPTDPRALKGGWWHAIHMTCNALLPYGKPLTWIVTPGYAVGSRPESYDDKAVVGGNPMTGEDFERLIKFASAYGNIQNCMIWGGCASTKAKGFRTSSDHWKMPVFDPEYAWWKSLKAMMK